MKSIRSNYNILSFVHYNANYLVIWIHVNDEIRFKFNMQNNLT